MVRWIRNIVIIVGVLALAVRFADWAARQTDTLPAPPKPNGYETLVSIAKEVTLPVGDLEAVSDETARQIAETNQLHIPRIHEALRMEIGVPLSIEPGWGDTHEADVKSLKRIAVALGIQSRAALLNGRTNEAAGYTLDVVLLGQSLARGGIYSDYVNGLVVETIGAAMLRARIPDLDAEFCRRAAQELETFEAVREPSARMFKTERDWAAASFGLIGRAGYFLKRDRRDEFLERHRKVVERTRKVMTLLAARAFELETGRAPTSPSDLTPGILKAIPVDPATGAPMAAIPEG